MNNVFKALLALLLIVSFAGCAAKTVAPAKSSYYSTSPHVAYFNGIPSGDGKELTAAETQDMMDLLYSHDEKRAVKYGDEFVSNKNTLDIMAFLPNRIAGYTTNGRIDSFEADHGSGYLKTYVNGAAAAYVYSYHKRHRSIPDGTKSEQVLQQVAEGAYSIQNSSYYGNTKLLLDNEIEYNGVTFRHLAFTTQRGCISTLFITGINNSLQKVRADLYTNEASQELNTFMTELGAVLKEKYLH